MSPLEPRPAALDGIDSEERSGAALAADASADAIGADRRSGRTRSRSRSRADADPSRGMDGGRRSEPKQNGARRSRAGQDSATGTEPVDSSAGDQDEGLDGLDADPPTAGRRARRPFVAGGLAGMWALLVGLALVTCLVMLAWAVSPNSAGDSAIAWSAAGMAWLGAHHVPLTISGHSVSLLPIGGLLLGLLLTRRSGAWTGRLLPEPAGREVVGLVTGAALVYGSGGAGVAWLATGLSASAQPAQAFLYTAIVAALGTLWGVNREADLVGSARARVSDAAWRTLAAALAAVTGLVAVGALLVTVSLLRSFAAVAQTMADLDGGPAGALGVTLLGALGLPNLDVWALSVLVGPGFEIGSIGGLSAFGGEVGSLPALPVLAAIPATVPGWAPVLLIVPVLMGALAGRIRWGRDLPTPSGAALAAVQLGAVVAVLIAGLCWLSSGSFGGGELAHVGPLLLPVTAAGAGLVMLGFGAEAAFQSFRLSWELHRAEQRAAAVRAAEAAVETETHEVAVAPPTEDEIEIVDLDLTDAAGPPTGGRSLRRLTEVPGMVGSFGVSLAGRVVSVVDVRGGSGSVDLRTGEAATEEAPTEDAAAFSRQDPIEVDQDREPELTSVDASIESASAADRDEAADPAGPAGINRDEAAADADADRDDATGAVRGDEDVEA